MSSWQDTSGTHPLGHQPRRMDRLIPPDPRRSLAQAADSNMNNMFRHQQSVPRGYNRRDGGGRRAPVSGDNYITGPPTTTASAFPITNYPSSSPYGSTSLPSPSIPTMMTPITSPFASNFSWDGETAHDDVGMEDGEGDEVVPSTGQGMLNNALFFGDMLGGDGSAQLFNGIDTRYQDIIPTPVSATSTASTFLVTAPTLNPSTPASAPVPTIQLPRQNHPDHQQHQQQPRRQELQLQHHPPLQQQPQQQQQQPRVYKCEECPREFTTSRRDYERHKAGVHGIPVRLRCGVLCKNRRDNIKRHEKKCAKCKRMARTVDITPATNHERTGPGRHQDPYGGGTSYGEGSSRA